MAIPTDGISQAVGAYSRAARNGLSGAAGGMEPRDAAPTDDFANLVRSAITEAKKIGERGEQVSIAAMSDKADLNQVVTAIAEAEVTLQTVVAVRDRVLDAYREIIRMPI